ncbi:hypothetical protein [Alicyclobacillus fodiniaquatilis]|uniref:hypothetical protein n=1 Tax=Alicyclobacillus fodiniaquatilis TaxID=1661150 RepID=UPI003670D7C3
MNINLCVEQAIADYRPCLTSGLGMYIRHLHHLENLPIQGGAGYHMRCQRSSLHSVM